MIQASLYRFVLLLADIPSFHPLHVRLFLGRLDCGQKQGKAGRGLSPFSHGFICIQSLLSLTGRMLYCHIIEYHHHVQYPRLQIASSSVLSIPMEIPPNHPLLAAMLTSSTTTSAMTPSPIDEDTSSTSYIPRMARMIPTSSTVHTVIFKKIRFPMTQRPDELWIVERNPDGIETWKPLETFLDDLDITHDPSVILHSANGLRRQHQVPPRTSSGSSSTIHHVLPHPEHSDVHFTGPVSVIPDHTSLLQACWGRSAYYHSQGSTASLYWPPWRNTPTLSQTTSANVPTLTSSPTTPSPAQTYISKIFDFKTDN